MGHAGMIRWEQFMDIKSLAAEGLSRREIARLTGMSRNTVRKVLRGQHPMRVKAAVRGSALDPYKAHVRDRFERYGLSAVRLIEEIRPLGYTGSVVTLRRYLKTLKAPLERLKQVTVRYETPPGLQAQVDFAEFSLPWGRRYALVVVLGYSRLLWVKFYPRQTMAVLVSGLEEAFAAFGGVPSELLFDQMRAVVIDDQRPSGGRVLENAEFSRFAVHWGFRIRACRPYRARTKGKVERPIGYLRRAFFYGRSFLNDADLNTQMEQWLRVVANQRLHRTIGEQPDLRFQRDERQALQPLAARPWRPLQPTATVVASTARPEWPQVDRRPLCSYDALLAGAP